MGERAVTEGWINIFVCTMMLVTFSATITGFLLGEMNARGTLKPVLIRLGNIGHDPRDAVTEARS